MPDKRNNAVKVALMGMDGRTHKTLSLFLQGPCKSASVMVVDDKEADIALIDVDLPKGRLLLEALKDKESLRPLIVLSLNDIVDDNILFLKKPVKTEAMLAVLAEAKAKVKRFTRTKAIDKTARLDPSTPNADNDVPEDSLKPSVEAGNSPSLKHFVADWNESNKTSKHRTAMLMDETGFTLLRGGLKPINLENTEQLKEASYNPKEYFQGYVQSAFKIACARGQVLQLNSGWKRLLIFPHSKEVWLDADDKQLRAFAGILINRNGNQKMSITALDPKSTNSESMEKFQTVEALLWKLACWTSKGRYPVQYDIERPVFLKHWPNFTRLLVTPHAIRIAALLLEKSRSPIDIAEVLDIKPEYVFVFVSAASAIGLLGQATRNADIEVAPPALKSFQKPGVLRRIINKLRAN
ncbi:MAG: hypothetical protein ACU83N_06565 [Gammaproteobacteria bacterium]